MERRPRRKHGDEFKQSAVELVTKLGYTIGKASRSLDLRDQQLRDWLDRMVDAAGGAGERCGVGRPQDAARAAAAVGERQRRAAAGARHPKKSDGVFAKESL